MYTKHFTHPEAKIGDLVFHYESYGRQNDAEKVYTILLNKEGKHVAHNYAEYILHDGIHVYRVVGHDLAYTYA